VIRSIFVFRGDDVARCHLGTGRIAARAHARLAGQLPGTQIPHAGGAARAIGALMIGVVSTPFGALAVTLSGSANDSTPNLGATTRAIDLAAIAPSADDEHRPTRAAEIESVVVQGPTPDDALLALSPAMGDGPTVRVPTRQGRPRVLTPWPSAFVPSAITTTTPPMSPGELLGELRPRLLRIGLASYMHA
jgi:hypothetical protein